MKQDKLRIIALIFMILFSIAIFLVYKEVKYYNDFIKETSRNPCAFCQNINKDVICQKIDTSVETKHPCQQCGDMGYGILGYEISD